MNCVYSYIVCLFQCEEFFTIDWQFFIVSRKFVVYIRILAFHMCETTIWLFSTIMQTACDFAFRDHLFKQSKHIHFILLDNAFLLN